VIPKIVTQIFSEGTFNLEEGMRFHKFNKSRLVGWDLRLIKCGGANIVERRQQACEAKYKALYEHGGIILDLDAKFIGPDGSLDWLCDLSMPAIAQTEKIVHTNHSHTDIDNAFMVAPKHNSLIGRYLDHGFSSYPFPLRDYCSNALNNFTSSFGIPFVALPPTYDSSIIGKSGNIVEHHRGLFEDKAMRRTD
jgi:hypothetical protein